MEDFDFFLNNKFKILFSLQTVNSEYWIILKQEKPRYLDSSAFGFIFYNVQFF